MHKITGVLASAAAAAHNDTKHPLLHRAKLQQAPKVWHD
jgi:hypothetical protein